ncbi:MAG TPA: DUF3592 domain-containing protein [Pyrinomonadaceae bacterium]|nr:DUF3592 domain-containing protein [Pyrinomonadaceae bacterium]
MRRKRVGLIIIAAITSGLAVMIFLGRVNWRSYKALAKRGIATQGQITAKEPENHMSIRYSYLVGAETFSGLESVGNSIGSLNVGDKVTVFYLPTNPALSCFCDPDYKLKSETVTILLAGFSTSFVVMFVLYRKLRFSERVPRAAQAERD